MATAADYEQQLNEINKQYAQYTPVNAGDAAAYLGNKVNNFVPQYNEIANLEQQAYASPTQYLQSYNQQYGNDPTQGLDATTMLNQILNQIGTNYGRADVARGVLNTQQGNLNQLTQNALSTYGQQAQGLKDQWGMINSLYQTKLAEEEAQRQAAAQAAQQAAYMQSLYGQNQYSPVSDQYLGAGGQEQDYGTPQEIQLNSPGNLLSDLERVGSQYISPYIGAGGDRNPLTWAGNAIRNVVGDPIGGLLKMFR